MHALPLMLGAVCVVAIAYRYYSAFLAAKVLCLDDARPTPAHRLNDGANYVPTNKWVLFGHHFAAISGAGPLVGPVLAAQFGFLPGYLWILAGVVLGGAVHDFVVLAASTQRDGKSLAEIVRAEIGPASGLVAGVAILFILVIAIAAMAGVVVNALSESAWGTFTIAVTIPIALLMGFWMHVFRKGKVQEASAIGVVLLLLAVFYGKHVADSSFAHYFLLSKHALIIAIAIYGFVASVLPVWILLVPRDYLSTYMKLGTITLLVIGVLVVNPELKMPAISQFAHGGGPIVPGKVFPFVFITIACGAISGFHGLVGSGTTSKMLDRESHARPIGYGAMLCEAIVGVVALIAANSLSQGDYFAINVRPNKFATLGLAIDHLDELQSQIGEQLHGKPGGAVTLAVGMSQIFAKIPGFSRLIAYWYHFAIMFEALFILTTVDAGTRVARFLVQEMGGRVWKPMGRTDWMPGALLSTALVCFAWVYFVWSGAMETLWPMLGITNQLLACIALCAGTTWIVNRGRARYAWVTLVPLLFVATATETAGYQLVANQFLPMVRHPKAPADVFNGGIRMVICVVAMAALLFVFTDAARKCVRTLRSSLAPSPAE
jgi:carbon starvation protein